MHMILGKTFFVRPTLKVAQDLLGKVLVRETSFGLIEHMITEVEAYDGFDDKASHASRGKTKRNTVMFERGGVWYVYFVYGMHEMLNIVVGKKEYPAAVLIRGVEGVSGPGRVTKTLGITRSLNGLPAARTSGLWIEDKGITIPRSRIKKSPRIGVDYAGTEWAGKRYRFSIC